MRETTLQLSFSIFRMSFYMSYSGHQIQHFNVKYLLHNQGKNAKPQTFLCKFDMTITKAASVTQRFIQPENSNDFNRSLSDTMFTN